MSRVASLDLGTHTFRLLIAEVSPPCFSTLLTERAITRLGEGLLHQKSINPRAMERGLGVVQHFAQLIKHHNVDNVYAVATSVLREAHNGGEFIDRVYEHTGIMVRILSGFEEALLTLRGVLSVVESETEKCLVCDIGGGSTEFVLTEDSTPIHIVSLNLGVVHLAERYLTADPPDTTNLLLLRNTIREILQHIAIPQEMITHHLAHYTLIGTAGTVTTLAAMAQKLKQYEPSKINNYCLTRETTEDIFNHLSHLPYAERRGIPGLEEGREGVIIPGAAVVLEIMELFGFAKLTVSDAGLLEGIVLDALAPHE